MWGLNGSPSHASTAIHSLINRLLSDFELFPSPKKKQKQKNLRIEFLYVLKKKKLKYQWCQCKWPSSCSSWSCFLWSSMCPILSFFHVKRWLPYYISKHTSFRYYLYVLQVFNSISLTFIVQVIRSGIPNFCAVALALSDLGYV